MNFPQGDFQKPEYKKLKVGWETPMGDCLYIFA